MQNFDLTEITWTEFITDPENFEKQCYELYNQQLQKEGLDYKYEKNILVDADYFLKLKTWERPSFNSYIGPFKRHYNKEFADIYTDILVVSDPDFNSDQIAKLKQDLNLDEIYCLQQTQLPGALVGQHVDLNRALSAMLVEKNLDAKVKLKNIRKYIVYLDNWSHGQVFLSGRHAHTNWRKGDVISFPWFMPHSTANAGLKPRPILFIAGVEF
jgi:hypothetical protein